VGSAIDTRRLGRWALNGVAGLAMAYLLTPLVSITWLAFWSQEIPTFPPEGYTLAWFAEALAQPKFVGGFLVSLTGYAVWGASGSIALGVLGIFVGHLGSGNMWANSRIYVQRETPDALRGRVMALDMVGFTLTMGVLGLVWGVVAQRTSPGQGVLSAVGITAVLAVIWVLVMARRVRRAPSAA